MTCFGVLEDLPRLDADRVQYGRTFTVSIVRADLVLRRFLFEGEQLTNEAALLVRYEATGEQRLCHREVI